MRIANQAPGQPEIFLAPQGEGPAAGRLSVFVRLSGCNLWCRWCDTAYTWRFSDAHPHDDDQVFDKSRERSVLDEGAVCRAVLALGCPAVVITGGEPLLQQTALIPVLQRLRKQGIDEVDFETNGTLAPDPDLVSSTDRFVVSPKLANSGVPRAQRHTAALDRFVALPSAVFKFVVQDAHDLEEVDAWVRAAAVEPGRVWLMPEGRTSSVLRSRMEWVRSRSAERGYRVSDRLHVHSHGDLRGV